MYLKIIFITKNYITTRVFSFNVASIIVNDRLDTVSESLTTGHNKVK